MERFRIFGSVAVHGADRWTEAPTVKQRTLLGAVLARPNEWLSTGQLIDAVWGDQPPRSAHGNLKTYVWRLRALETGDPDGSRLEARPGGYRMVVRNGELDLQQFERAASHGRAAFAANDFCGAEELLVRAQEIWRGEPFEGTASAVLDRHRARLSEQLRDVRSRLVEVRLAQGRPHETVGQLVELVSEQPLCEQWWALLIRALTEAGRRGEAVAAYRRVCGLLDHELGLGPGAALRAAYQLLLAA